MIIELLSKESKIPQFEVVVYEQSLSFKTSIYTKVCQSMAKSATQTVPIPVVTPKIPKPPPVVPREYKWKRNAWALEI